MTPWEDRSYFSIVELSFSSSFYILCTKPPSKCIKPGAGYNCTNSRTKLGSLRAGAGLGNFFAPGQTAPACWTTLLLPRVVAIVVVVIATPKSCKKTKGGETIDSHWARHALLSCRPEARLEAGRHPRREPRRRRRRRERKENERKRKKNKREGTHKTAAPREVGEKHDDDARDSKID